MKNNTDISNNKESNKVFSKVSISWESLIFGKTFKNIER